MAFMGLPNVTAEDVTAGAAMLDVVLRIVGALADWLTRHLRGLGEAGLVTAHTLASVFAVAGLTCAHIVIGEMLPKSLALQHTERAARWLYWPMRVSWIVTYPFVWLFNRIADALLRLVGVRRSAQTDEQLHTPEELRLIVEESEEGGALREESSRLLRELFEFGDLTASRSEEHTSELQSH